MINRILWNFSYRMSDSENCLVYALSTQISFGPYLSQFRNLDRIENFRFAVYIKPNGAAVPCWNVQDIGLVRRDAGARGGTNSRLGEGGDYY